MSERTDLPPAWVTTTLECVAEIRDDLRQPVNADERANRVGPYPYYGATGQVGWIDGYLMDGEYVLLGEDGAPFLDPSKPKAYMVSGRSWVNNHAHVLKALEGISDNRFVMYALNAVDYRGLVNGTTRLKLTQGAMKLIPINLPSLKEQRRIVQKIEELFTELDAGVTALERVRANLKRYRAAVLKAAVEGALTADWRAQYPDVEPAGDLLQRILRERRDAWEQAELARYAKAGKTPPKGWQGKYKEPTAPDTTDLPDLPEGWCWTSVEQLASTDPNAITDGPFGSNLKSEHYTSEGARVIRLQNIGDGVFKDEKAFISQEHFQRLSKHRVFPGDVVIAALGENPPRACIIPEFVGPAIVKADCIRFNVSSHILNKYADYALNANPTHKRTALLIHGVGRPRLNLGEIKAWFILRLEIC